MKDIIILNQILITAKRQQDHLLIQLIRDKISIMINNTIKLKKIR